MLIVVRGRRDVPGRDESRVSGTACGLCLNDAFIRMCAVMIILSFRFFWDRRR